MDYEVSLLATDRARGSAAGHRRIAVPPMGSFLSNRSGIAHDVAS